MKILKIVTDNMVLYGILSIFISMISLFMMVSLYSSEVLKINPWVGCFVVFPSLIVFMWMLKKSGLIDTYYETQHRYSPVLNELTDKQDIILKRLKTIEGCLK